jgi:hypothetical protein
VQTQRVRVADALAALGPVLLLASARDSTGGVLAGWARFVAHCEVEHMQPHVAVEPDGIREELALVDAEGAVRYRLVRLPDSDFLGWEQVLCELGCCCRQPAPAERAAHDAAIAHRARKPERWLARAVRLGTAEGAARDPVPLDYGSWTGLRVIDRLREREDIALAP